MKRKRFDPGRRGGYSATMSDLASLLARSPDLFPLGYDRERDAMLFADFDRAAYEAASFLDERVLSDGRRSRWVPAEAVVAAAAALPLPSCGFIFHIGHVGSTLIARLAGAAGALSLRERAALRVFADGDADASRLDALLRLWSRGYEPNQPVVVKATSFVSEIAGDLIRRTGRPALAVVTAAEPYLAGILGGLNSRKEIEAMAPARAMRLDRRLPGLPHAEAEGERIALSWLCESTALLGPAPAGDLRWLDFEAFLADPVPLLCEALAHLGIAATPDTVAAIAAGPLMTRYSKAPEHGYTPELRRQVLDGARAEFGTEIAVGLRWLDAAARARPEAATALALFA